MDLIYFLIDFILHIDVHLAELVAEYGVWVYAILFLILFCETGLVVTPFLPGDSLLFVAGALASLETNDLNVHIVRTFAPFVAGMGHMSYRHFAAYNVIGALLWVLLFTYAGYFFGTIPMIQDNLKLLIVGIIVVSILPGVVEIIRHKRAASRAAK